MRTAFLPVLALSATALLGVPALAASGDPPGVTVPAGAPALEPSIVLQVPWGSGGAMLAKREGNESSPEAPMSFAVAANGDIVILDQVSSRVVRFDARGTLVWEHALPGDTFQDVEVAADGRVIVLDRLVRRTLYVVDPKDGATREVPLEGEGVPEGGGVTALLARPDGVWVEVAHAAAVRVLDERLEPCERATLPGRPSARGGRALRAALQHGAAAVSVLARDGEAVGSWLARPSEPAVRIAWLEDDADGDVAVVVHVMRFDHEGMDVVAEWNEGRVYGPDGALRATLRSPWVINEYEQLREFDLGADGHLYQLAVTPEGVKVVRFGGGAP